MFYFISSFHRRQSKNVWVFLDIEIFFQCSISRSKILFAIWYFYFYTHRNKKKWTNFVCTFLRVMHYFKGLFFNFQGIATRFIVIKLKLILFFIIYFAPENIYWNLMIRFCKIFIKYLLIRNHNCMDRCTYILIRPWK